MITSSTPWTAQIEIVNKSDVFRGDPAGRISGLRGTLLTPFLQPAGRVYVAIIIPSLSGSRRRCGFSSRGSFCRSDIFADVIRYHKRRRIFKSEPPNDEDADGNRIGVDLRALEERAYPHM
jgi:hypothetical protein